MASSLSSLPSLAEFFPPTPRAFELLFNLFRSIPVVSLTASSSDEKQKLLVKGSRNPKTDAMLCQS